MAPLQPSSPGVEMGVAEQPTCHASSVELVAAARRREPRAWEELITRYGGLVGSVVASYRLQEADAADAVQSTWLRSLRGTLEPVGVPCPLR